MKNLVNTRRLALVLLLALAVSCLTLGQTNALTFPDKPETESWIVDEADLIGADDAQAINETALALFVEQRVPMYVVTIRSMADYDAVGYSIEGYAADLFDHWGIGFPDRNYGMLLLVSKGDRKARIELGADWGREYDWQASNVMQSLIIPAFKRGDFSTGIRDGVKGMDALARGLALPTPTKPWWVVPLAIALIIGLIMLIFNLFKTGRSGWGWALIALTGAAIWMLMRASASSSGGSGGGFGGGSSGGGGASGSW